MLNNPVLKFSNFLVMPNLVLNSFQDLKESRGSLFFLQYCFSFPFYSVIPDTDRESSSFKIFVGAAFLNQVQDRPAAIPFKPSS
jgi:hypothetical protein